MDEAGAMEILGDCIKNDNSLNRHMFKEAIEWDGDDLYILGDVEPDELEAIAWWMGNKGH